VVLRDGVWVSLEHSRDGPVGGGLERLRERSLVSQWAGVATERDRTGPDTEVFRMEDARQQVTRWMEDAPQMVAELVDHRDRALAAEASANRELERLRGELAAVRADHQLLRRERTENADLLAEIVGKMSEMLRWISAPMPEPVPATGSPIPLVGSAEAADPPSGGAPVAAAAGGRVPATAAALTAPPPAAPRPRRILLVDDDADFRTMIIQYLTGHRGYEVLPAASGEEALQLLDGFQPEVVLLDLMMPGIGGMEALKQIKARCPNLCVVMVTANEDLSIARKALALGAADYLTKPFDPDYLDALLNIYLTGSDAALHGQPSTLASVDRDASGAPATRPARDYFARH